MSAEQFRQDQTQFIVEEPLMEKPQYPVDLSEQPTPPPVKKPRWELIIGAVLIFIIGVIGLAMMNRQEVDQATETPEQVETAADLDPLSQRLQTAQQLLREANPTTLAWPFPPVDLTLRIDEARN